MEISTAHVWPHCCIPSDARVAPVKRSETYPVKKVSSALFTMPITASTKAAQPRRPFSSSAGKNNSMEYPGWEMAEP
jgi:hypothetical protein